MSDIDALTQTVSTAIFWRQQAENMERQRDAAFREVDAAQARADGLLLVVAEMRAALESTARELQMWHDTRPDPPGPLKDYCVSCGYLDDVRALLAAAPEARAGVLLKAQWEGG